MQVLSIISAGNITHVQRCCHPGFIVLLVLFLFGELQDVQACLVRAGWWQLGVSEGVDAARLLNRKLGW